MESEIMAIIIMIIDNNELKNDYIDCLNKFVLYGNKGRDLSKEPKIKMELGKYIFQKEMKDFLQAIYFLFNCLILPKKNLSKEYLFQKLQIAKDKLQNILTSIENLFKENTIPFKYPLVIENSPKIIDFCESFIQFDDPFLNHHNKITKKSNEKQIVIAELENEINKNNTQMNNCSYNIQNDISFVLAVLSEGFSFSTIERFMAKINITIAQKKKFI